MAAHVIQAMIDIVIKLARIQQESPKVDKVLACLLRDCFHKKVFLIDFQVDDWGSRRGPQLVGHWAA